MYAFAGNGYAGTVDLAHQKEGAVAYLEGDGGIAPVVPHYTVGFAVGEVVHKALDERHFGAVSCWRPCCQGLFLWRVRLCLTGCLMNWVVTKSLTLHRRG